MSSKNIFLKLLNKIVQEKQNVIHIEEIFSKNKWDRLKKSVGTNLTCFVITPANYDYCKSNFDLRVNKKEFEIRLKERYSYLREKNEIIQLSIHLCKHKKFLDNQLQEKIFKEAIEFMNSLNIKPDKLYIIDGIYNNYSIYLGKKYEISEIFNFNLILINPFLKIIEFLGIKRSFIQNIYDYIKNKDFRSVMYLILGEFINVDEKTIHAEALVREDVWNVLKRRVLGKGYIWFIITPTNYEYCKTFFNIKVDKNEFSNILKKRIIYLKNKGEEIQLHIHLTKSNLYLDKKLQRVKFKEAINFLRSINLSPRKFAAGWWVYNNYTLNLLRKYGFEELYDYTINPFVKFKKKNGIKINFVHKYWHDFEFI